MQRKALPEFEMRHRMELALEYGSVSINDIARELGISRTTVSNYLHGRTQPQRSHLIVWAFKCGVPFDWLVGQDSTFLIDDSEPEPIVKKAAPKATKPKAARPAAKPSRRKAI